MEITATTLQPSPVIGLTGFLIRYNGHSCSYLDLGIEIGDVPLVYLYLMIKAQIRAWLLKWVNP